MQNLNKNKINEFIRILDDPSKNENDIQQYLEENSELIPLPYLDNHHLHFNALLSKFHLGNEYITDLAYLTKSSDYWHLVLIEFENPKKKLFTQNSENIYFSSDFNHAYDQISSWKSYIHDNKDKVLKTIDKIRVPLNENSTNFKYILFIGRSDEKINSEKRRKMLAQKNKDDVIVLTYDSIISHLQSIPYAYPKLILSTWKEQGYKVKYIPSDLGTSIFAYVHPEYLKIDKYDIEALKAQGYKMDDWLKGNPLLVNDKYPNLKSLSENTDDPTMKAFLDRIED